jgi:hypothetical protein
MSRCFYPSTRTDEITSLHQNCQCHGSVEQYCNYKLYVMFSLTTLPVDCCSTVFTDVTSLTSSPTLITLLANRTYISACNVRRQIQRRCEFQFVPQYYSKMYWPSHETKNLTNMELTILLERDIAGAGVRSKVLVRNFSRWSVLRLRSCDVTPCSLEDKASDPNRP